MPSKNTLGQMIAAHRRAHGFIQKEVAERVGMTRENYSQLETGRRKEPLTPQQAKAISRLLGIPMLGLVNAMGYPVEFEGIEDEEEVVLLKAYRRLTPDLKQAMRAIAALPGPWQTVEGPAQLRRLAETDRPDHPED